MKRLFSLILASVLLLAAACAVGEGVTLTTKYFTMQLPEGWLTETEDLEQEEGMEVLGYFGEDQDIGFFAIAILEYFEDLKDISLWNSDAEELEAYKQAILEDYADDNPVYLDTVMAGQIPIILIKATDEDGEYLYADTMANGYAIEFQGCIMDNTDDTTTYPLSDAMIEQFKEILSTFVPVT